MIVLELGQVVDVLIDDHPEVVWLVMRRHVVFGECFGHDCLYKQML